MNLRHLLHTINILFLLALYSCTKHTGSSETLNRNRIDSSNYYFEQGKDASELRQKITFFNKALDNLNDPYDTLTPVILDYNIYYYNRLKEYDSALYFSNRLIEIAKTQNDSGFMSKGFYRKSAIFRYLNQHEKAFKNAYNARQIYLEIGDSASAGRRTSEMAIAQSQLTDYVGAQESATEALKYLPESDSSYISSAYNTIATAYRSQGFYLDAETEWRNALKYATTTGDSLSNLNNIALSLQDQKKYGKAIEIFENIIQSSDKTDIISLARFRDNLAYTKWLQDSSLIVNDKLLKATDMRRQAKDQNGLLASYDHLSAYYTNKDSRLSQLYADSLLKTAEKLDSKSAQINAIEKLIQLSSPEKIKDLSNRYIQLNDSIKYENIRAKNFFAKIRYDEEQKQQEINDLLAETIKQDLETKELKNQSIILSLGGLLLMLSGGFAFYYLRQKHKREKIREANQTETRISKKIHDELANDVYNVMSEMENLVPATLIDKLEHIYSRTRNISRENASVDTGPGYINNLIATLSAICNEHTRLIIRGEEIIDWNSIKEEKKLVIFRVLQEVMVNMKKHSQARLVAIIFSKKNRSIEISYSDNGIGCSPHRIKNGNGIQNVENRIFSTEGSITFETEKGKGLKILIKIPV